MGIPIVTVGKQHVCPMKDGNKPHKGGQVIKGITGVFIDGIPVATVGSTCVCCSPKTNSITSGAMGVLVDGKAIAILGSQTEHGGNVIEGNPGVTVSGGFATRSNQPEDFEPKIFNLQWKNDSTIIKYGEKQHTVILSADTVGYDEGEMVKIRVSRKGEENILDEIEGTVKDGRIEVEWEIEDNNKE